MFTYITEFLLNNNMSAANVYLLKNSQAVKKDVALCKMVSIEKGVKYR